MYCTTRYLVILFFSLILAGCLHGSTFSGDTIEKYQQILKINLPGISAAEGLLIQSKNIENNDPGLSLAYARRVERYALIEKTPLLEIQAQLQIANVLVIRTKFADAMKIALQARALAEKLQAYDELGMYYEIAGRIKSSTGDYEQSLDDLFRSLKYFDKDKDLTGTTLALNSIGTVYYWRKDYEKALGYYIRAMKLSEQIKDTIQIARSVNNVGVIHMSQKDYVKALDNFSRSKVYNQKSGQLLRVGGNMMNIAIIHMHLKNFDQSLKNYQDAISIFSQLENYLNLTLCNLDLGYYYEERQEQANRIGCFRKALQMSRRYGFKGIEIEAVTKLQEIFFHEKNLDSAYFYANLKTEIKDSLQLEKSQTRLSIAELQYQYEKREQEVHLDQQRKNFILISFGFILVALIIIAVLVLSRQVQKNKAIALEKKNLADEVEFKNKELAINVMNLLKRNEFIVDTSRRILDLKNNPSPKDIEDELYKIAKTLQDETGKEGWEEFDMRFKQVHNAFYDRLLAEFPDLSPNELRLCALLKLNLTTKDISELTGQRRETVEMARFRLRKHLGIQDPAVNLINFLSKY